MSYCDAEGECAVTVYAAVSGGITCCACLLQPLEDPGDFGSVNVPDAAAMLAHLDEHIAAGHGVSEDALACLREEAARAEFQKMKDGYIPGSQGAPGGRLFPRGD